MLIKKYEAVGLIQLSTYVIIKGKRVDLRFTPGTMYYNKYASYTTGDKAIQEALESMKMFKQGRLRIASITEKIEPPKEIVIKKEEPVNDTATKTNEGPLEFEKLKDLQVYLMKNHKVSFPEVRSRENALAKAKELNLEVKIKNS